MNLMDFTLARYLRFRFQGMHTTLQSPNSIQWLVDRDQLNKRSFYSLRYIKIGARLDCNGHASRAKQYSNDEVRIIQFQIETFNIFATISKENSFLRFTIDLRQNTEILF